MLYVPTFKTDIFPVILCVCEIWCLTSREEHRLRVCESGVVSRIFDEREVGIEGCKKFCSEIHVCYTSRDVINVTVAGR
jgi:hypothetical protein